MAKELHKNGAQVLATCRASAGELESLEGIQILKGVEVQDIASVTKMCEEITEPIDIVINNAGYFPDVHETMTDPENPMNFAEGMKQIDICAMGPLRVTYELNKKKLLKTGGAGRVIIISSQAGSAEWRKTQNQDEGGDYGHHMCRAATNISGVLMSEELKKHGISVVMLHPGFNRTGSRGTRCELITSSKLLMSYSPHISHHCCHHLPTLLHSCLLIFRHDQEIRAHLGRRRSRAHRGGCHARPARGGAGDPREDGAVHQLRGRTSNSVLGW
jgi:NAD(P)-dependent dehydrogenase (short-subunit alcohol dehydrogenase family)